MRLTSTAIAVAAIIAAAVPALAKEKATTEPSKETIAIHRLVADGVDVRELECERSLCEAVVRRKDGTTERIEIDGEGRTLRSEVAKRSQPPSTPRKLSRPSPDKDFGTPRN
jgi:hypothetical protein